MGAGVALNGLQVHLEPAWSREWQRWSTTEAPSWRPQLQARRWPCLAAVGKRGFAARTSLTALLLLLLVLLLPLGLQRAGLSRLDSSEQDR